jgi:hypothetical protein
MTSALLNQQRETTVEKINTSIFTCQEREKQELPEFSSFPIFFGE